MGQEGSYVDIPNGSNYYIKGNGKDVGGLTYEQFAALIGSVVDEIEWGATEGEYGGACGNIKHKFAEHFGGWDSDYNGCITPPERGEIFCQCVDRRIESLELTENLQNSVKEWVNKFDSMRECVYCGNDFRPKIYNDETKYICSKDKCGYKHDAEIYGVEIQTIRQAEILGDWLYEYNYTIEETVTAELEYLKSKSGK